MTAVAKTDEERLYKRRILAWTMYDWANSAFATTVMAAVLPVYYSQVAASTLPSAARATAYWSSGLSISTLIIAILSPILGTISDIMRGKKAFLAVFWGLGVVATGLLVLVGTGDWFMASVLFVLGRIGFNGANVFYDSLLPHVARQKDLDTVSTRGYAMGYLGGGLLLAIDVVLIQVLPGNLGAQLSFVSVAIWWAIFSIPLFRLIPEPVTAGVPREKGTGVLAASFSRLAETLRDIRQYKELFKFVLAFLIYADGIGTIIELAAIYGAELGLGSVELILALLLVQFVGIPYSLIFGQLPNRAAKRRPFFLAFIILNAILLPVMGIAGRFLLPVSVTGISPQPYQSTALFVGQGTYAVDNPLFSYRGDWQQQIVSPEQSGEDAAEAYRVSSQLGDQVEFPFHGQQVRLTFSMGPEHGVWQVLVDESPLLDPETNMPLAIDLYSATPRYAVEETISVPAPGEHRLILRSAEANAQSQGNLVALTSVHVLVPKRSSQLGVIFGVVAGAQLLILAIAYVIGHRWFAGLVDYFDTKRSVILALCIYIVVSVWAFFLDSTLEYWFLAWMIATVQGGSQALSRSLFSTLAPAAKSGQFFGLFGVMEKFSAIFGPLVFALVATRFNNSRPAILSIVVFFIVGALVLWRVNVAEGQRLAKEEDAAFFQGAAPE